MGDTFCTVRRLAMAVAVAWCARARAYDVVCTYVRFDMPRGFSGGFSSTHYEAQRVAGPDAVDWPDMTCNGQPVFRDGSRQTVAVAYETAPRANCFLRQPYDNTIMPGSHWFRGMQWMNEARTYTADRTARAWSSGAQGLFELFAFPVVVAGQGAQDVRNVRLTVAGATVFSKPGPWRSLTLLLPASEPDKPYELTVDGRGPVRFHAGLEPVEVGNPRDVVIAVDLVVPGAPAVTVRTLNAPSVFAEQAAWDQDIAALAGPMPAAYDATLEQASLRRHVNGRAPRSGVTVNAVCLPAGMSGGFYYDNAQPSAADLFANIGSFDDYAAHLANVGFDRVVDRTGKADFCNMADPAAPRSFERWAHALARRGVRAGLSPDTWEMMRPHNSHPNIALFCATLPDYRAPLFRQLQLQMQRLSIFPNLFGVSIGADNACYTSYWDWAGPIANRPWAEAMYAFEGGRPFYQPAVQSNYRSSGPRDYERLVDNARTFLEWVHRYDETFTSYGYFEQAVSEVAPGLIATTGSFGSSPGGGANGGWDWATAPGKPMHRDLRVMQAYDWNEHLSSKPMHNTMLVDVLRSYYPDKELWTIIDDFKFLFGRETRQRAYAIALTRGVQAVGTNFLANPSGGKARPDVIAQQKELFEWVHRYGGAYGVTRPLAPLGIMYVKDQALMRRCSATNTERGSHEGKVTEALVFTHAAGWPARVITPEELLRGLPASMRALLLVGLHPVDSTWHWYDGLAGALQAFVAGGGVIVRDDESECPVESRASGMVVRAYLPQADNDFTPELYRRNADNMTRLRTALAGVPRPIAWTADQRMWVIPHQSAATQYVTCVNWNFDPAQNASAVVRPLTASLSWNTSRPIYDVRTGARLTAEQAATCDLTTDGFRLYALPAGPPETPGLEVLAERTGGMFQARITMGAAGALDGIPVSVTVRRGADSAEVYSATGLTAVVPLSDSDPAGEYVVTVRELLTGRSSSATVTVRPPSAEPPSPVTFARRHVIESFAGGARRSRPLVIGLTDAQQRDTAIAALAGRLRDCYEARGRTVSIRTAGPLDIVRSLQPFRGVCDYPRWSTIEADLILLGNASNNVLIYDQARGRLLPAGYDRTPPGAALVAATLSPFAGEYHCINIIAPDNAGLREGVDALTRALSVRTDGPERQAMDETALLSSRPAHAAAWPANGWHQPPTTSTSALQPPAHGSSPSNRGSPPAVCSASAPDSESKPAAPLPAAAVEEPALFCDVWPLSESAGIEDAESLRDSAPHHRLTLDSLAVGPLPARCAIRLAGYLRPATAGNYVVEAHVSGPARVFVARNGDPGQARPAASTESDANGGRRDADSVVSSRPVTLLADRACYVEVLMVSPEHDGYCAVRVRQAETASQCPAPGALARAVCLPGHTPVPQSGASVIEPGQR